MTRYYVKFLANCFTLKMFFDPEYQIIQFLFKQNKFRIQYYFQTFPFNQNLFILKFSWTKIYSENYFLTEIAL